MGIGPLDNTVFSGRTFYPSERYGQIWLFLAIWLFFIAQNAKTSADELNSDLKVNLKGHPQQKMSFNPDMNYAQEAIFS